MDIKWKRNTDSLSQNLDVSLKSIIEITESTKNNNEDSKPGKKAINENKTNGNNIAITNITGKSVNNVSKENQN